MERTENIIRFMANGLNSSIFSGQKWSKWSDSYTALANHLKLLCLLCPHITGLDVFIQQIIIPVY